MELLSKNHVCIQYTTRTEKSHEVLLDRKKKNPYTDRAEDKHKAKKDRRSQYD